MKTTVAILAGGKSSEKNVSLKSATGIYNMLDKEKYEVYKVYIGEQDEWYIIDGEFDGTFVNKEDFGFTYNNTKYHFDFAFIAIHGTPGEDGILQGFFEMINIPYSTGDVLSTALTFNKNTCNNYLKNSGIRIPENTVLRKGEYYKKANILGKVGMPCFIKPSKGGSSFGISKVTNAEEFDNALETAFKEDDTAIIEEYIKGRELTCGAVKTIDEEIIFPVTEIISKKDFFDYQAKYNEKYADEVTPAQISESIANDIKFYTNKIYDYLECEGIIRVDYIWDGSNINFLEVNTVPGMTERSLIPQQIEAMGLSPSKILDMVITDKMNKFKKAHPHE